MLVTNVAREGGEGVRGMYEKRKTLSDYVFVWNYTVHMNHSRASRSQVYRSGGFGERYHIAFGRRRIFAENTDAKYYAEF